MRQSTQIEGGLAARPDVASACSAGAAAAAPITLWATAMTAPAKRRAAPPDDVHRALRVLAAQHGRSTEAEVRDILAAAVKPATRQRLGDALGALGRDIGLTADDLAVLEQTRDKAPAQPLSFK